MKPKPLMTSRDSRRESFDSAPRERHQMPATDYRYHSIGFEELSGRYLSGPTRSFWSIAGDYLQDEARHDFWGEAALFAFITITAALPLMNNLHALIQFVRAITSH